MSVAETLKTTMTVNTSRAERTITIAVAGNPNSGKSTLINAIAGSRLNVGNWPGVTVEKKEALFEHGERHIRLIDLPGAYSLSPYTQEEIIARDYLITEAPDVIVNVVDSTNLERNLYLTIQLLELGIPVIIALNMFDEAEAMGLEINTKAISDALHCPVIPTVATKKVGLKELLDKAIEVSDNLYVYKHHYLSYGEDIDGAANLIERYIKEQCPDVALKYPLRWVSYKLIESDPLVIERFPYDKCQVDVRVAHIRLAHTDDIETFMAEARYSLASGLTREVLKRPKITKSDLTERIDRVVLNRFFAIPIFLLAMWLVFKLTFDISQPFADWIDSASTGPVKRIMTTMLEAINSPAWLISLLTEGVVAGVGMILTFVPVIFAMMFFVTFLEGSGYMARAAFVMDRAMHSIGLHGKSFIPMLLGFGCNVPAIYATRTLENPRDKVLTALLIPFMSCGARLPVYALFAGVFFADRAGAVLWSLYVLGIIVAVFTGLIFKRLLFKGDSPVFIMELPPYRIPSVKNLLVHTWEKGKHFLIRAGTYILVVSVAVWLLLHIPWGVKDKKDSLLGQVGQAVAPAMGPLGFGNWEAASSLITGIIAKEIIVSTMAVIYATSGEDNQEEKTTVSDDVAEIFIGLAGALKGAVVNVFEGLTVSSLSYEETEEAKGLRAIIQKDFSALSAYGFMVFVLLYMPCMVVGIAMRQEFGSWKWFALAVVYQMAVAWLITFVVYQGGRLLALG